MNYRKYKGGDPEISLLGMGMMRLPKLEGKEDVDYEKAGEMIDYALKNGINYFDTAHMYHGGDSQKFVGHSLANYDRSSYHLATKMPMMMLRSKAQVAEIFETQKKNTRADYFDFYLVHNLTERDIDNFKEFEVYEFLSQKKAEGEIRRLGFSSHNSQEGLEKILSLHQWDFVQIQLNYLDWTMQDAKRQYELIESHGAQCVVMEPVRGGRLADLGPEANAMLKAARPDMSIASWGIRFAMSLPNVLTVLSGMTTMEQLKDNIGTASNFEPVTDEELMLLDKAVNTFKDSVSVPCTACRYCSDCPVDIDIPKIMEVYNAYALDHSSMALDQGLRGVENGPDKCIACGACASVCPQNIAIPDIMAEITEAKRRMPGPPPMPMED